MWLFQTAHFSAAYRTIAIDLAGYGRSPAPTDGVTIADQAVACWEAIDTLSSGAVIIQGNSMGSFVAMHMAVQHPDRCLALILSGTAYLPRRDMMVRRGERYRSQGIEHRREQVLEHFPPALRDRKLLQYYADMVCEMNNASTLDSIVLMQKALSIPEADSFFDQISTPTLIITGSEDPSREAAYSLQSKVKGSRIVCIDGAGHSCNIEMPWEFDRHCSRFLAELGLA